MLLWYLQHEQRCTFDQDEFDLYQFGVPSDMLRISALLRHAGLSSYTQYNGFDSFTGLPEEAASSWRPSNFTWGVGQFSLAASLAGRGVEPDINGAERYKGTALTAEAVHERMQEQFNAVKDESEATRVLLVRGYFNESLTAARALAMRPALYADFNADLYVSTSQALRWLAVHRLLRPGSLIGYDDWSEVPFLRGGESKAHFELAHEQLIEFEHLPNTRFRQGNHGRSVHGGDRCRHAVAFFRVRSVGVRADPGVDRQFALLSCRMQPMILSQRFQRNRNSQGINECVALYKRWAIRSYGLTGYTAGRPV